jgi:hypothetical protein
MGYLQSLHEAHKARLRRLGAAAPAGRPHVEQQPSENGVPPASNPPPTAGLRAEIERLQAENARLSARPTREPEAPRRPTIAEIKVAVAKAYDISAAELERASRESRYLLPRMIAIHLARKLTVWTFAEIARCFGRHGHGTAMNADWRMLERRKQDPAFDAELRALERQLATRRPGRPACP